MPNEVQQIPFSPVPTQVSCNVVTGGDGKTYVLVVFITPQGQQGFFFEPDNAKQIAGVLNNLAQQASTGLVIPAIVLPPGVNGNGHAPN